MNRSGRHQWSKKGYWEQSPPEQHEDAHNEFWGDNELPNRKYRVWPLFITIGILIVVWVALMSWSQGWFE